MCHTDESRPPSSEGPVPIASTEDLVLTAADGNRLAAFAAHPAQPSGAGVVVMPDARGLHEFYKHLAVRFAESGIEAVAIDYFGRTAGIGDRSESFDFRPHSQQTTPAGVAADVAAASDTLRATDVSSVFTVGFCLGGGYSWRQAADLPGLAGAIGFYGRPAIAAEAVERIAAPLLILAAGSDAYIPVADVESFANEVRAGGADVQFVAYDGAPHSFFDRSFAEHEGACADAWQRVRTFISRHAG